jgi:hypothetical protein
MGKVFGFRGSRAAVIALALLASVAVLVAQTVVDPRTAEFDPSPDHSVLATDGTPLVDGYKLHLYTVGQTTPFQTVNLGKPALDPDGKIRVNFVDLMSSLPAPGVIYEARVAAYGAGGSAASEVSNTFEFSAMCSPSLASAGASISADGGTGSVGMNIADGCLWTAVSNNAWITITSGSSGSGSGTISFSVAPNSGTSSRTGTITAGGETFTITQASTACTYSLSPSTQSVPTAGGTAAVTMTAGSACSWNASSNSAWLTVTGGASGSGNGTISLSAAENPDSTSRTGTITAGGKSVTVTQAGAPCTYSLVPAAQSMPAAGGTGSVGVSAGGGCSWTATSNAAWLTVTSGQGTGAGTISFNVGANASTSPRTGTITAAGQTVTVTQAGAGCTYSVAPLTQAIPAAGGSSSAAVTTSESCSWTAASNDPWITITGGASGSGNGAVSFSVAPNPASSSRTGTITAGGRAISVTQPGLACTYAIAPAGASVEAAGGSAVFSLTAGTLCAWTATSNAPWITITAGASGWGDGTIGYAVATHTGAESRTGTITAGGQTYTITQSGAACSYALIPASQSMPAEGGAGTVTMTGTVDCNWTAASSAPWLTIAGGASGSGGGTISYSVAPNGGGDRTGTITAGGQTFTVSQAGLPCTYTLAPTSQILTATAAAATVNVNAGTDCAWAAVSSHEWLTIDDGASGSGSGTISYSVSENTASVWRTGSITVAGQRLTVSQAGTPCTFTLDSTTQSMPAAGGTGMVGLTTNADCFWLASSQASWLTITSGTSGAGSRTFSFSVAPNTGTASRTGTLTIAGQVFTVTQDGAAGCAYALAPASQSMPADGGAGTISMTTTAGCSWTAVSNAAWIAVTAGASGTDAGTIGYSVAANTGSSRTGTISAGGQTFTVTQEAGEACAYVLAPTSQIIAAAGGAATVGVTAGAACSWSAESSLSWVSIASGATGAGNGTVGYTVAPNTGTTWRTGTLTIAGQKFTVSQSGVPCTFTLSSTSTTMAAAGGTGSVTLTTASTCFWLASSKVSWITITSGTSGSGTRTFTFTVAPNTAAGSRTGTMVIGGQTFTVTQAGQ